MASVLTQPVADALAALEEDYALDVEPLGDGGAVVVVQNVDVGSRWSPEIVHLEFLIPFNYPYGPIYPYYVAAGLAHVDGTPLPNALQQVEWRGKQMIQISLRANRWTPGVDTAHGAVAQVVRWFRELA